MSEARSDEFETVHAICDELDESIKSLQQAKFTIWNQYAREHCPGLVYESVEEMVREEVRARTSN